MILSYYIQNFPIIFFYDELLLEQSKIKKFNIIGEIAHDLINNSKNKLKQENSYIFIFKILEKIRTKIINFNDLDKRYIEAIESLLINDIYKENIFIFFTNGSFFLLKFAIEMLSKIFKNNINDEKVIKDEINKTIINNNEFENFIDFPINIEEKIYQFYIIFKNLRDNKIRHCLFYIGEENGNKFEDNLIKYRNFKSNYMNEKIYLDDILINQKMKGFIKQLLF